jgi:hypothetical protein
MTEIRSDNYFAIVPEWLLHADVSGNAVRLYAILNRYANSNGHAWPSRKTIAAAMKCSTATVDRARDELVQVGALTVKQRFSDAGDPTSNLYILHTLPVGNHPPSSQVTKGMVTDGDTGIPTDDELNRASMNESHSGTPSQVRCGTCNGRRIVFPSQVYDPERGWVSEGPRPCPECQL